VVVAGQRQRSAQLARSGKIGMAQGVAGAIHPGPLAVPDADHAVDLRLGQGFEHLRALDGCRGDILVEPRPESDVVLGEYAADLLQRQVVAAQRRAFIPRDEAARVPPRASVLAHLLERQTHERLDAGHVGRTGFQGVFVVQRILAPHAALYSTRR
jgi:hypothetical protein